MTAVPAKRRKRHVEQHGITAQEIEFGGAERSREEGEGQLIGGALGPENRRRTGVGVEVSRAPVRGEIDSWAANADVAGDQRCVGIRAQIDVGRAADAARTRRAKLKRGGRRRRSGGNAERRSGECNHQYASHNYFPSLPLKGFAAPRSGVVDCPAQSLIDWL